MIPNQQIAAGEVFDTAPDKTAENGSVLDCVDFGIATYDNKFNFVCANSQYFEFYGHNADHVTRGTPFQSLLEKALIEAGHDEVSVATEVSTALLRLKAGGKQKQVFRSAAGRECLVTRQCDQQGNLVETIQDTAAFETHSGTNQKVVASKAGGERLMHAFEAMTNGFALYDSDDNLVAFNRKFCEIYASIADLMVPGQSFEKIIREGVARGAFDTSGMDDETYIHWRLRQHFDPGEPREHKGIDGRWIRTQELQTEDGGIVSVHHDITELKAREYEIARISSDLDRTNDHFNEALNNMAQGLCMFNADQRLILCNRQYLDMYGFSDEVVKPGILISDIMRYSISLGNYREEDAQAALKARHDPDRLKKRTTIKQYLRDERVIAVMNEPMANGGTIATYLDITATERHEAQLLAYTDKLEISNRELQEFAYVASHDLQEPLRKIETFSDRLLNKYGSDLPEQGTMFVERMQNAAFRMRQLINDLLSYSRVTTNAKPFDKVDLMDVLEGVISDLQMRIQDSNGTVEVDNLPTIEADGTQMRQLFQNLISNALKFKKPDVNSVVSISAIKQTRANEFGNVSDFWEFRIADNGIGFDNKYKNQIFTIFQRLHGRLEYEGTGIGLATCRKIVERHSGTIDADGEPDVGATFIVEFPALQNQDNDRQATS